MHLFRAGALPQLVVETYTRLDARPEWALTSQVSGELIGQNLFDQTHSEFRGHETNLQSTLVPRSGGVRVVWGF